MATEEANAEAIQNTVKAKYDDTTWVTVGKPLNDTIREASKEALIAYILANAASWGVKAPDDGSAITLADQLYEYFLIDVSMSPCMLTSRIVQASAAVQLFVQRCLLNLEPTVSPAAVDPVHWSWMQNYRVWEANRMVLCYPEAYIVPTLRDDQTPLFQTFAAALLQNPITEENVEQAYLNYLYGLDQIARLDIRASYWQIDPDSAPAPDGVADASNDVLHVFARTTTLPSVYYYRQLLNCGQYGAPGGGATWTAWELVDASVEGDHLVPVVWDARLFLFWPVFAESADPGSQGDMQLPPSGAATYSAAPAVQDLTITLNWSEYRQGAWSSKQASAPWTFLQYSSFSGPLYTSEFSFNSSFTGDDSLVINMLYNREDFGVMKLGHFTFSSCGSTPIPSPDVTPPDITGETESVVLVQNTEHLWPSYDFLQSSEATQFALQVGYAPVIPTSTGEIYTAGNAGLEILAKTPSSFRLMFPQQYFDSFGLLIPPPFPAAPSADDVGGIPGEPFFYEDADRVYFVTERFSNPSAQLRDPSHESTVYSRATLTSAATAADATPVFALAGNSPVGVVPAATPRVTAAPLEKKKNPKPSLSQILLSNHFHPFSCTFIGELNRYGMPEMLTLANQELTNDGGRISGFTLSPSATSRPGLTAGALYAQGKLYAPAKAPTLPPAPADQTSFVYYNSSSGFYYNSGFLSPMGLTDSPKTAGDAVIGLVNTDHAGQVTSIQSFNNGPYATMFYEKYAPTSIVNLTYPLEQVDFSTGGAYSIYNWELFFHIPVLIATQLDQNQQFDDAEKWWRYIINPYTSSTDPIPQRYWQFLPFYQCSPWDTVAGQIQNIFYPPASGSPPSSCGEGIADQIAAWQDDPFNPFLIARMRPVAFRMYVVMTYIQHHLSYGDYLFAQNTRESINEATLHYVLAQELLGPQPVEIPTRGTSQDYTYNDLATLYGLDDFPTHSF